MAFTEVGIWAAFVLTLMVYSYLIADTFLYRAAVYVFAGLTAGFVAVVTFQSVLAPWLRDLQEVENILELIVDALPILFVLVLALRPLPVIRAFTSPLRRIVLAFLIGVGAALAIVGAVTGTVIPLTLQTGRSAGEGLVVGLITIIGVVTVLSYFQYSARRRDDGTTVQNPAVQGTRAVGGAVLAITFGTIYAAAIATAMTVFTERVS
ncbi:MAG: hypothetical protein AAF125_20060, partial [Chloroflexota bacterium]